MLIIRLARFGKSKNPTYRFIISEKTKDTKGTYLEVLGWYRPKFQPAQIEVKGDRIKYWLSKGAQMSATVHNLLVDQNIVTTPKVKIVKPKKKKGGEAKAEEIKSEKKVENNEADFKAETKEEKKSAQGGFASGGEEKPAEEKK